MTAPKEIVHMTTKHEMIVTFDHELSGWPATLTIERFNCDHVRVSLSTDHIANIVHDADVEVLRAIVALVDGLPALPKEKR